MLINHYRLMKDIPFQIISKLIVFLILLTSLSCEDEIITANQKGTLILKSSPSQATIYINDNLTSSTTPDTIVLDKGQYSVKLELIGYVSTHNTVVIETDKTTILEETLVGENPSFNILLTTNTLYSKLFFSFQVNQEITLESIRITHPTTNNGNYVIYNEGFNNILINPAISYRFPQQSTNDFLIATGTYTFLFKGKLGAEPFEKEVIYQRN